MNAKSEIFYDAITLLPEEIVEEAQNHVFRKSIRSPWKQFGTLAACLMLAVSLGLLAAMPKGCGGGAPPSGNGSGGPVSTDTCEPADAPEPGYGSSNTPQIPESGAVDGKAEEAFRFTAKVVEILDSGVSPAVLVEPLEGEDERNAADRIVVPADGEIPALEPGDLVEITYDGTIQETYPARITGVSAIEKLEK